MGAVYYSPFRGPRMNPKELARLAHDKVTVKCEECERTKRVPRASVYSGNPGECCGMVMSILDD